jgi:hypothetical protein
MPTDGSNSHTNIGGCEFPLWTGVPEGWLRRQGRTRVLVIDDQFTKRQDLFHVSSDRSPQTPAEKRLDNWMNVQITFLRPPSDYQYGIQSLPTGTFSVSWFDSALEEALQDETPIAAVLLDLLFGNESEIETASGPAFLARLRERAPDLPVLILSNLEETLKVRGIVKAGGGFSGCDASFQDYLPKRVQGGPGLMVRLAEKLVAWGHLSDPALCAFSQPMRRLACQMRRIVLRNHRIDYQTPGAGKYPKPVVLMGEYGSGKNYIASMLQAMSRRRSAPFNTVNFAGHNTEDFTSTLFGATEFTGAGRWYDVRPEDGVVLGVRAPATARRASPGTLCLAKLGVLHLTDIADQDPGQNCQPLQGTLLIDEIGTAPESMQTRLLGVFNEGRFTPHLGNVPIPTHRSVDVWFLVTLSPEGREHLREDLGQRLAQGHRLEIPSLYEREEDVVAISLQVLGADATDDPKRFFTREGLDALKDFARNAQVRELKGVIQNVAEVTANPPYSGMEIKKVASWADLPSAPSTRTCRSGPKMAGAFPAGDASPTGVPGALAVLQGWYRAQNVDFPAGIMEKGRLRGKGVTVVGGAAAAILSYLELCAIITADSKGYSATRTWNYFAGTDGTKAPDARTQIAPLFLIDHATTLAALRRSEVLLWLAQDVAQRRKKLRGLIECI